MYWFAAVNDNSQMHKDMYLVALKSAILNTTLKPILIYDGEDKVFSSLVEKNATLIKHKTLLYNKPNFLNKDQGWKNIACGAYLRIDIPIICKNLNIQDEFVLYTDTDVIFLKDVVNQLKQYNPTYFSICPEFDKNNYTHFNSGVMLMNVKNMLNTYKEFTEFIDTCNYNFDAFDQGALRTFYNKKNVDKLPLLFNHKPYWGIQDEAFIVHYHGPKYNNIKDYLNGNVLDAYRDLYNKTNKESWIFFMRLYELYKEGFNWKQYFNKYPDLQMNGLKSERDAITHWYNFGINEGRSFF